MKPFQYLQSSIFHDFAQYLLYRHLNPIQILNQLGNHSSKPIIVTPRVQQYYLATASPSPYNFIRMAIVPAEHSQLPSSIELADCILQVHNPSKTIKGGCKFCLDRSTADNPLITACQCTYKQAAVHSHCLQTSIQTKIERLIDIESDWNTALVCEICQNKFSVQSHAKYKCTQGPKLKKAIQRKSFVFWTCVIGLIIALSLMGYTADLIAKKTQANFNSFSIGEQTILVSAMLFTSIVSLILSTKLLQGFFLRVESVYNKICEVGWEMTDRRFIQHQHLDVQGDRLKVECRFCRHAQEYNKYVFVAPCGCAGPTRFVHRTCLQRWAIVKFEHVYNQPNNGDPQEFNVFCEMCQQRMEIEFSLINKFSKYEDCVEKISDNRLLFALLIFLAVASITAIIFMGITALKSANGFSTTVIIVFSVSCFVLVVATVIFFWKFMIIRSIDIEKIPNNKDPPKIVNFSEQDIEEIPQGPSQDPYFGVESAKHDPHYDKSLMLESKRDSASSVVSKTFTDILMKKMYNHDNVSVKNMKDRENQNHLRPESRKFSNNRLQDREVQVTRYQKKDQQIQMSNLDQKRDQSMQYTINQKDQSVQKSQHVNNQSIQPSNHQKDASVQPSVRKRRIFKEDTSVQPRSSVVPPLPAPLHPPPVEKNYLSDLPERDQIEEEPADQQRSNSNGSSNQQKRSDEELVPEKPKQSKLKLKSSKSPIKIRVVF